MLMARRTLPQPAVLDKGGAAASEPGQSSGEAGQVRREMSGSSKNSPAGALPEVALPPRKRMLTTGLPNADLPGSQSPT